MRRYVVTALAALVLASVVAAQTKDDFEYWDADSNGDLKCEEAYGTGGTGGLKLPAYEDDRNGTALIFEWLQRKRSSSGNTSGDACTASKWNNPNGYVPSESTGTGDDAGTGEDDGDTTDTDDGTDDDTGDTDTGDGTDDDDTGDTDAGDGTGDEETTSTPILPAAGLAALALSLMMAGRRAFQRMHR